MGSYKARSLFMGLGVLDTPSARFVQLAKRPGFAPANDKDFQHKQP